MLQQLLHKYNNYYINVTINLLLLFPDTHAGSGSFVIGSHKSVLFSFKWLVEAYNNHLFAHGFENTFLREEMGKVLDLMKRFIIALLLMTVLS